MPFAVCLTMAALAGCGSAPEESAEPVRSIRADVYLDKVHGAWLGAAAGGALGMSVEGMPKADLKPFLSGLGQWPLTRSLSEY